MQLFNELTRLQPVVGTSRRECEYTGQPKCGVSVVNTILYVRGHDCVDAHYRKLELKVPFAGPLWPRTE
jgi:hypothetical protein